MWNTFLIVVVQKSVKDVVELSSTLNSHVSCIWNDFIIIIPSRSPYIVRQLTELARRRHQRLRSLRSRWSWGSRLQMQRDRRRGRRGSACFLTTTSRGTTYHCLESVLPLHRTYVVHTDTVHTMFVRGYNFLDCTGSMRVMTTLELHY